MPTTLVEIGEELAPVLDDALNRLRDEDRQALLLRFFYEKPMREVGRIFGVSEDAAKMRVGRALERLRAQLAERGTACTAIALGALLAERSLEAAPVGLVSRLRSGLPRLLAPSAAIPGALSLLLLTSKAKRLLGLLTVLAIVLGLIVLFPTSDRIRGGGTTTVAADSQASLSNRTIRRRGPAGRNTREAGGPDQVRLVLRVLDAETGDGLAQASVRAVYFYAGGRGEPHELATDENGRVGIPEPHETDDHGMNVFVTAEGHVPKCLSWNAEDQRSEHTMKLDPARAVGGTVVDEAGNPVAGVKITVQGPGNQDGEAENGDFQTSDVTSDATGSWLLTCLPKDYESVRLILWRASNRADSPPIGGRS